MLQLHKIKRVSHVVAYPIVFILLYEQCYKAGVFKVMKIERFLVLLAVWVLFPKFFWQVKK